MWDSAGVLKPAGPQKKGTSEVNGTSTQRIRVEPDGRGVVAHVGLHAVGAFADKLGVGDVLSSALPYRGPGVPIHNCGKVLVHTMLMLAGGGESCTDMEHLRAGPDLFGAVPSDTTVARTFTEITAEDRQMVAERVAELQSTSGRSYPPDPVLLDVDALLVEIHSENKEQATPTYKRRYRCRAGLGPGL